MDWRRPGGCGDWFHAAAVVRACVEARVTQPALRKSSWRRAKSEIRPFLRPGISNSPARDCNASPPKSGCDPLDCVEDSVRENVCKAAAHVVFDYPQPSR